MKGKQTCKILKEIRKQIAEKNDIELAISECTYKGDCLGTCPKCEAEVRYLERELEKRERMGKAAVVAGISLGTLFSANACRSVVKTTDPSCNGTQVEIPEGTLRGDVVAVRPAEPEVLPDSIKPLGGIVPLLHRIFAFDSEQYETLLKDLFVFPGMDHLSVVSGEILYEQLATDDVVLCQTLEEFAALTKEFTAPSYRGGERMMLEQLLAELEFGGMSGNYSGDMEVAFLVTASGSVRNVEVVKGIDKTLDHAVAAIFERMAWNPAYYDLKSGAKSFSFECRCIQEIHFPIVY